MKIGFVFDDSLDRDDGVQQYIKRLGAFYTEQGHEVRYLVGETIIDEWRGGRVYSLSRNISASFNKNRLSIPLPASRRKIEAVLNEESFDILHVQLPCSPLLAGKIVQAAPLNTAVVGTFHVFGAGKMVNTANKLLGQQLKPIIRRFDQIWSVSSAAVTYAAQHYGIESEISPNIVDVASFRGAKPLIPHKKGTKHIVFLGRLVERKGARALLQAFAELVPLAVEPLHLYIGGSGPLKDRLQKEAVLLGLEKSVTFLGYVDEKDKPGLLASADLAVFPSLYGESFGIVLIEAMAAGAGLVMGGNNPGYSSVLAPWPQMLCDPTDKHAFAKALAQALRESKTQARIHREQQKAVDQYDVQVVGNKLLAAYAKIVALKQPAV